MALFCWEIYSAWILSACSILQILYQHVVVIHCMKGFIPKIALLWSLPEVFHVLLDQLTSNFSSCCDQVLRYFTSCCDQSWGILFLALISSWDTSLPAVIRSLIIWLATKLHLRLFHLLLHQRLGWITSCGLDIGVIHFLLAPPELPGEAFFQIMSHLDLATRGSQGATSDPCGLIQLFSYVIAYF